MGYASAASAAGAVIGSVIPGIGNLVGAAAGFAIGTLIQDNANETADMVEDIIFDESNIQFTCPQCGYTWTNRNPQKQIASYNSTIEHRTVSFFDEQQAKEEEQFYTEFEKCMKQFDDITSSKEKATNYILQLKNKIPENCWSTDTQAKYYYLQAFCYLECIVKNRESNLVSSGTWFINQAVRCSPKNNEYRFIQLIYSLSGLYCSKEKHFSSNTIQQLQQKLETYQKKARNLTTQLIKKEYLTSLCETVMSEILLLLYEQFEGEKDYIQSEKCLKMLYALKNPSSKLIACFYLSKYYHFGREGVPMSRELGFRYASEGFSVESASDNIFWIGCLAHMAYCYLEGFGTIQDYTKAYTYTLQAAQLGDEYSMYNLAEIFEIGRGVPRDSKKALEWYQKAVTHGVKEAEEKVKQLSRR